MITLTNGKRVANFSSPHDFTFTDGSVLPRVSDEDAKRLSIIFMEKIDENGDVELSFSLNGDVNVEIEKYMKKWYDKEIDVVFCPLPMITALKEGGFDIKSSPFRAIRIEDRIKKLVSIEKQCI